MSKNEHFDSVLGPTISRYLTLKRALGHDYSNERYIFQQLDRFLATTQPAGTDLCAETFALWCQSRMHQASGVRRNWMCTVRNLCLYRRRLEPGCFVPDPLQFPPLHQPVQPYIFSTTEIRRLLAGATALEPTAFSPLRPEVFHLAIVLLYTTGLRRGELLRLTIGDCDLREQTLLVRNTKFHKSRLLPLSHDATDELEAYLDSRRAHAISSETHSPLIWNRYRGGCAYTGVGLGRVLRVLFSSAGIHTPAGRLPRVHDMRHTFAVQALLRWYRQGVDVQTRLPALATYMGHVSILSTQYYLQFVEALAGCANDRFEHLCGALVTVPGDDL